MFGAGDLDVFLKDMGITVTAGAYTFTALFDQPDHDFNLGNVSQQSTEYSLTCKTADANAAGLQNYSVLMFVNPLTDLAGTYKVRTMQMIDDGGFTQIKVSKQ